jgi:hypothetical protein
LSFLSRIRGFQWFRKTTWFKPSCKLPGELVSWLANATAPNADGTVPGIVLLSHHQYFSSFDDWYQVPAQQQRALISPERRVLWFRGHEHRFAIYDSFGVKDGIQAFGRCIGHGGMPVDRESIPDIKDCNCVLYDDRAYTNTENINVGYNGFITLTLDGPRLEANYYDLYDTLLLTEGWSTDRKGELRGPRFSNIHPDLNRRDPAYISSHSQLVQVEDLLPKVTWYPDLPSLPDDEQRWFTQAEIRQIVDAATGQYKVLFHLAGYTGLRSGELVGLHVEDLKLEHGVIEVRRAVWNGIEGDTKTKSGKRNVFIDSVTIRLLRCFLAGRKTGRLFQSRAGTSLENRDICRRVLTPICEKLGMEPGDARLQAW